MSSQINPRTVVPADKLQAMLNFASKSILSTPIFYQRVQLQPDAIVEQQFQIWKACN